ncbi:centromere protein V-like [Panicum virgatum]|uniref:CENP-V/GFA domain-containing protein n=1 Tax=Panicum virgatum TaxID=38727 RepID=A0A8T0WJJ7_PANVG|nr:centromere protein V-like [Panicum virgatum]KAG2643299.1 hypothetical protein PVAP13_2KG302000 [Panicum virgatum]
MSAAAPDDVVHAGGCHCRRVRWRVEAPASVVAWVCNCSDCSMRGNPHFVVPAARFKLQPSAEEFITTYTFGTHTARHTFCKACGITSFYTPRSNPDGVAVTVACVDPGTLRHVEYREADGRNWEEWFERSRIAGFSKGDKAEAAGK